VKILSLLAWLPVLVWGQDNHIKINDDLELIPISKNAYIHISYPIIEPYGRVACNGLIYISNNEAIIADTPATAALPIT